MAIALLLWPCFSHLLGDVSWLNDGLSVPEPGLGGAAKLAPQPLHLLAQPTLLDVPSLVRAAPAVQAPAPLRILLPPYEANRPAPHPLASQLPLLPATPSPPPPPELAHQPRVPVLRRCARGVPAGRSTVGPSWVRSTWPGFPDSDHVVHLHEVAVPPQVAEPAARPPPWLTGSRCPQGFRTAGPVILQRCRRLRRPPVRVPHRRPAWPPPRRSPLRSGETFRALKPGLSAYADDPEKCAAGITELLEVAKSTIPPSSWTLTPVVLKATAGLRLLPGEKAEHLLDRVRALFSESPFLSRDDSVSIMDGTDEGISAWITVNFLTGDLHSEGSSTVGMLDLGGGSTQITFSPQDEKTIQTSPIDYIRSFRMFNSTHTVYTHSYLGLGLMSARLAVLGGVEASPRGSTELVSPCLAPGSRSSWEHADVVYSVRGQTAGEPVYEACRSRVQQLLYKKVQKATEAKDVDFYAFSYYYDRAVDFGAIEGEAGGTIRVLDYQEAAERVCSGLSLSPLQSPFLCLDLVYISVLLQELGFPPHKQFKLARTIDQVETSWALGATFHYIESLKRH